MIVDAPKGVGGRLGKVGVDAVVVLVFLGGDFGVAAFLAVACVLELELGLGGQW